MRARALRELGRARPGRWAPAVEQVVLLGTDPGLLRQLALIVAAQGPHRRLVGLQGWAARWLAAGDDPAVIAGGGSYVREMAAALASAQQAALRAEEAADRADDLAREAEVGRLQAADLVDLAELSHCATVASLESAQLAQDWAERADAAARRALALAG